MKRKLRWWRIKAIRWWQGVAIGEPPSRFGKGKFVDTLRLRGGRIMLVSHEATPRRPKGTLILTPYWGNHGFMVKFIDENGRSPWTSVLGFDEIYQLLGSSRERRAKNDT